MGAWTNLEVNVGGRRIATRQMGAEDRPPVILMHGLGGHQRSWNRVAKAVPDQLRLITFDYRGHGKSEPAQEYSLDGLLTDLEAVIDRAGVVSGYCLVGHSMGADVALLHGAEAPGCRGVVLVDGALPLAPPATDWERLSVMQDRFLFKMLTFFGRRLGLAPSMSITEIRSLAEDVEARRRHFDELLSKLRLPVLYVIGNEADRVPDGAEIHDRKMTAVSELSSSHPGLRIEFLPCGHLVPVRQPDALARLVSDFVSSRGV